MLQRQLAEQSRRIERLESQEDAAGADADAGSFTEDVQALSTRLGALESEEGAIRGLASEFLESPSTESLRSTTGRLHLDYWTYPGDSPGVNQIESGNPTTRPLDRFELRRVRIGIRGSVPPNNVSYQLDLEFSGIDQIGIRDAWIGWESLGGNGSLRIGNQKRPYALDQLNSSNFTVFLERPFINDSVNDPNRRLGMQAYGTSSDLRFNWRFGVFNLMPIEESGVILNNNYQSELAGRLALTAWHDGRDDSHNYLHLGVASSFGFPSDNLDETTAAYQSRPESRTVNHWLDTGQISGAQATQLLGTEMVLNIGAFQFGGEYMNLWLQREDDAGPDLHLHGGYCYLSYFLTGERIPWNRRLGILGRVKPYRPFVRGDSSTACGWGAWQIAARGSLADLNDHDILGGRGRSATLALNWYWNSHTRLQLNYIIGRIDDRRLASQSGVPDIVSGDYQIIGTRMMVDY